METVTGKKKESEVAQSYPALCNPMDHSPPGSSVHGIFQARVLEWGATAFWIVANTSNYHRFLLIFTQNQNSEQKTNFFIQATCRILVPEKSEKHHTFNKHLPDNLQTNTIFKLLYFLLQNRDSFQSTVTGDLNLELEGLSLSITIDTHALGLVFEPQFLHL